MICHHMNKFSLYSERYARVRAIGIIKIWFKDFCFDFEETKYFS